MWWFTTLLGIIVSVAQLASSDVVLVQWGRRDCEGRGAELVYSGLMAGPSKTDGVKSSVNKHLCLPNNPTYGRFDPGKQNRYTQIFRVEYQVDRRSDILGTYRAKYDGVDESKDFNGNAVPCAVCLFFRTSTHLVIPGKYNCPYNWRTAYSGYLMASEPSGSSNSYYPYYRKKRQTGANFGESADPPPGMDDPIPTPAFPDFPPGIPLGGGGVPPLPGMNPQSGDPPPLPPTNPQNGDIPPLPPMNLPMGAGNPPPPPPPPAFNPQQGAPAPQPGFNPLGGFPAPSGPPTTTRPLDPRFVQMCGTWYDYWSSMQKMYAFSSAPTYPSYPSYPSYQTSYPNYGSADYNPGAGTDYNAGFPASGNAGFPAGGNTGFPAAGNAGFPAAGFPANDGGGGGGATAGMPGDAGFSDIGYSTDIGGTATGSGTSMRYGRQATWNPQPRQGQPAFRQVATTAPLDDREKFIQSCATYYEAAERMKKLFEQNNPSGSTYPSRPAQAEQNEGNEEENPRVTTSRQQPLKTNYVCVAGSPDVHALGKQDAGVAAKITPVEASCNDLPCPRYREGRELQCVVCVR